MKLSPALSRSIFFILAGLLLGFLTTLLANASDYLPLSISSPAFAPGHMQSILQRTAVHLNPLALASSFRPIASSPKLLRNYSAMSSSIPEHQKFEAAAHDTVDSDSFHPGSKNAKAVLPLPAPGEGTSDAQTIDLSGEGGDQIKLDALGPMVVNKDGTLSRIANWQKMTDIERKNTLRILGKRNQLRLASLRDEEEQKAETEQK